MSTEFYTNNPNRTLIGRRNAIPYGETHFTWSMFPLEFIAQILEPSFIEYPIIDEYDRLYKYDEFKLLVDSCTGISYDDRLPISYHSTRRQPKP